MTYVQNPATPQPAGLSKRQRRGALLAGAIGFGFITLGTDILGALIIFVTFWVFFLTLFGGIGDADQNESYLGGLGRFLAGFALPLSIIVAVALIALVMGFLASRWILRAHNVERSVGVTWSGFAVSAIPNGFAAITIYFIGTGVVSSLPAALVVDQTVQFAGYLIMIGVHVLVGVAIGALVWWWMAHVLRPRADNPVQPQPLV